jgi:hypothetical protein
MPDPDLWGRLPEGVGQEAFFQVSRSAPGWEPLQKLDYTVGFADSAKGSHPGAVPSDLTASLCHALGQGMGISSEIGFEDSRSRGFNG